MNVQKFTEERTEELRAQQESIQKRMQELQDEFERCRAALFQIEGALFELSQISTADAEGDYDCELCKEAACEED